MTNDEAKREVDIEVIGLQARFPLLRDPAMMKTFLGVACERIGRREAKTLTQVAFQLLEPKA